MNSLILFASMFISMALGVPIAMSMGLACLITILLFQEAPIIFIAQGMHDKLVNFPIMAIPFFVIAGLVMSESGLAKYLVDLSKKIMGSTRGGLINVGILACVFFAGITGSNIADVVAITTILFAELVRVGYRRSYAAAALACAGITGPIVPPSIGLLIYGVITGTSVVKLFTGGILPGILIGGGLMITNYFICKKEDFREKGEKGSLKEVMIAFYRAKWALLTPVIILGGIYGGIFTPTEAGAVTLLYGVLVGLFVYKGITFKDLPRLFIQGSIISISLLLIIGLSGTYGRLLTVEQIPQKLTMFLSIVSNNKYVTLFIINVFLLFLGCVMEGIAAILIFSSLLLDVVKPMGVNPVHFGIILIVNLCIGSLTPPVAQSLFASSAVTKEPFEKILLEAIPFIVVLIITLFIVTYIPEISMLLVNLIY